MGYSPEKQRAYYAKNKKRIRKLAEGYYYANRAKLLAKGKEYRDRNRKKHPLALSLYQALMAVVHPTPHLKAQLNYRGSDKFKVKMERYRKKNKDVINMYNNMTRLAKKDNRF